MPAFSRPPEWQQPADRHTALVDPVLTVRQLGRLDLNLKPLVRMDHALVFTTPKGGYDPFLPPRRPSRGEIAARRYTSVYEVDMGVHPFTAELALPSDNDAFEFTASVDLSWQVLDPARFVVSGHRDVPRLLLGELQQAARPVTRRFAIADSADAEYELLRAVTVLGPLGESAGLRVDWTLRLRRDQEAIDHQRRLQTIDHTASEQIRATEHGMRVDAETDRRARQQDRLQLDRAMEYGVRQQEFALQQQNWQHALAMRQGQHLLELQRVEAEKISFYQWHLSQGGVQAWALHLAQHPEDSQLVMNTMREDQLRMIQAQMDLVAKLLSDGTPENYELEGPKQLALRTVSDILNQRLPGVPQTPPLIAPTGVQPTPAQQTPAQEPHPLPGPRPAPPAHPAHPAEPQDTQPTTPAWTPPVPSVPQDAQPPTPAWTPPIPTTPAWTPAAPTEPQDAQPAIPAWAPPVPPYPPPPTLSAPYPGTPAPPPVPPQPPAWQPPPGYGSTPTLPAQTPPGNDGPPDTPDDSRQASAT